MSEVTCLWLIRAFYYDTKLQSQLKEEKRNVKIIINTRTTKNYKYCILVMHTCNYVFSTYCVIDSRFVTVK